MHQYTISASAGPDDLIPVMMAMHELLNRLPVVARSRDHLGIRIEDGRVVDTAYTGPVLEEVLEKNQVAKTKPVSGVYAQVPVVVTPVRDQDGDVIAAIGVVDITGIFDLANLMEQQSTLIKQVCGRDPCPLPGEQIGAKR